MALHWEKQNKEILLHVHADNYDYLPIRGWWVDENDVPLAEGQQIPHGGGFQIQANPYGENRSWMCFRGWREYHDHESHQDVSWSSVRSECGLLSTLLQLKTDLNKDGVSAQ